MRLYAILADIHGNYEALQAVVRDAQEIAEQEQSSGLEFISLGDVVGYGPQPNECVEWVDQSTMCAIRGNHDREACAPLFKLPLGFDEMLYPMIIWTRLNLQPANKEHLRSWRTSILGPTGMEKFVIFHSSLVTEDVYINNQHAAGQELMHLPAAFGLFGHTHLQGYYYEDQIFTRAPNEPTLKRQIIYGLAMSDPAVKTGSEYIPTPIDTWLPIPTKPITAGDSSGRSRPGRCILNPGSLGQPRQSPSLTHLGVPHDYRAAYLMLRHDGADHWYFCFRRVEYEWQKTVQLMRQRMHWPEDAQWSSSLGYSQTGTPRGPQDVEWSLDRLRVGLHDVVEVLARGLNPFVGR